MSNPVFQFENLLKTIVFSDEPRQVSIKIYPDFIKTVNILFETGSISSKENFASILSSFFAKNETESQRLYIKTLRYLNQWDSLYQKYLTNFKIKNESVSRVGNKRIIDPLSPDQNIDNQEEAVHMGETEKPKVNNQLEHEKELKPQSNLGAGWSYIALALKDTKSKEADADLIDTNLEKHYFNFSDESILPLSVRYITQRSRKAFESPNRLIGTEFNIPKMVDQYASQGIFTHLSYESQHVKKSNIVLFIDRQGSMLSYEFLEDLLVESFYLIPNCLFEIYQFYNLPLKIDKGSKISKSHNLNVYQFHGYKGSRRIEKPFRHWNKDTCFIIFSDAGAHSGIVVNDRIKESLAFWDYLQSISEKVFWLNPVPISEMNDCTASRLSFVIPMYDIVSGELNELFESISYV